MKKLIATFTLIELLAVAIAPRLRANYDKKNPPKRARDWFDSQFQVVTPANIQTAFN